MGTHTHTHSLSPFRLHEDTHTSTYFSYYDTQLLTFLSVHLQLTFHLQLIWSVLIVCNSLLFLFLRKHLCLQILVHFSSQPFFSKVDSLLTNTGCHLCPNPNFLLLKTKTNVSAFVNVQTLDSFKLLPPHLSST